MKKSIFTGKLISSIFITMLLIYFMLKTTSPKIIFVPFLICGCSMIGKNIALLIEKEKYAVLLDKFFVVGFLLFWFGFLLVASYICVRDGNYGMMIFSIPFWLVGIYVVKSKLLNIKSKSKKNAIFNFKSVISAGLVIVTLLVGAGIAILGVMNHNIAMIFLGVFFIFGAFTFVVGALTVLGYFDKFKVDVLGLYIGVLFVIIGSGFLAIQFKDVLSFSEVISAMGIWILIPIMLIVVGAFQIVKCLNNKKSE